MRFSTSVNSNHPQGSPVLQTESYADARDPILSRCGPGRIRTDNPLLARETLFRWSYKPVKEDIGTSA